MELVLINDERRRLVEPIVRYVRGVREQHVFVLIPEVEPERVWQRILQNQRGGVLAHALRRDTEAVVCRLRFRMAPPTTRADGPPGHTLQPHRANGPGSDPHQAGEPYAAG
ncbi:hypothetical protein GCM10010191_59430 [Actinomadura vinacea]|uniref:Uncharacterized protein n=1 Tax=Actinomadura vinacea TaxID=115336 RepID=A0ABP5WUD4_9ACTN